MSARLGAEMLGSFWLVFGGCGTAVLGAYFLAPDNDGVNLGVGHLGVAIAFGLTVLTGIYALGAVSGGHFNPAVTFGLALGKRFPWKDVVPYWVVQVIGATLGGAVLLVVANGVPGFSAKETGFATNGYGDLSPGGYSLFACAVIEVVLTAMFLYVIMGATDARAPIGFAGAAIGLALTLIHLISIPITNTSVNPARSLGVAWFAGADAMSQVWLFLLAPLVGGAIAGVTYALVTGVDREGVEVTGDKAEE